MQLRKWYRRPSALLIIPILLTGGCAALALITREKQLFGLCLPLIILFVIAWGETDKKEDQEDFKQFIDDHFNQTAEK